jgi:hypothetical protein
MVKGDYYWQIFIYAIPVMSIVNIVFSYVWFDGKFDFLYISFLVWSILATIYFAISTGTGNYDIWPIFALGIPAQVIIFLCFKIKISIKFTQKEHFDKKPKKEKADKQ